MLCIWLKLSYLLAALKLAEFLGEFGLGLGDFLLWFFKSMFFFSNTGGILGYMAGPTDWVNIFNIL